MASDLAKAGDFGDGVLVPIYHVLIPAICSQPLGDIVAIIIAAL
jgi:hypothetical protein